jgi:hypothetical protein
VRSSSPRLVANIDPNVVPVYARMKRKPTTINDRHNGNDSNDDHPHNRYVHLFCLS